jgi:hypothetical protein
MTDPKIFERNMLAIASWHGPLCAERLRSAVADRRMGFSAAQSGSTVPYITLDGRKVYLHSKFNPEREAVRLADQYSRQGFYAFLGLGAGFGVSALLNAGRVTRGIIVEYNAGMLRAILELIDMTHVLGDRRLRLFVDPSEAELDEALASSYVPSVTGDFVSIPLRGRIDIDPDKFQGAAVSIKDSIGIISDDYSVQSFFGKRWFSNIVRNLEASAKPTPPIGPIREAIVTAAGPSLEAYFDDIAGRPRKAYLIATDTSLRALLDRGIQPDAVISIDCQHISYYHFSLGLPEQTTLFIDLASPPTVTRLASKPYFFSSGHPLSRYIASRFRAFPVIDTSGGNVTHAAVSLAAYLGAESIRLYGADFSYPFGKSYARGTYIYPYFDIRQSRIKPQESLFAEFLYRNQTLDREEEIDGSFRYVTKPLVAYKERLERMSPTLPCAVERVRGHGVAADMGLSRPRTMRDREGRVFAAGRPFQNPTEFLSAYAQDMEALPEPYEQAAAYLDALSPHEKDVWTTMLPSTAAFRREAGIVPPAPVQILKHTRDWCIRIVREELQRKA